MKLQRERLAMVAAAQVREHRVLLVVAIPWRMIAGILRNRQSDVTTNHRQIR
jgi:hypothetical protein